MPNWFYFSVHVSGEKKDVEQFVENVKGSEKFETEGREFDFNHFIPQPDNIFRENIGSDKKKELDAVGVPNWYDWNNSNWGTKWNANIESAFCLSSVDGFPMEYEYELATAWAFPTPVIDKMIQMYPNLDFTIVGEEESGAYGVYWNTMEDIFQDEEPDLIDDSNGRLVYYDDDEHLWKYSDDNEEVPDPADFYPQTRYSWS
jgi:hypothetical protein